MSDNYHSVQPAASSQTITAFLTTADQRCLLQQQTEPLYFGAAENGLPIIQIDRYKSYQTMEGFGFSLTGGSALLISRLPEAVKRDLLNELFTDDGIGVSVLRLSIGASDLSERSFSYDDLADGESDFTLSRFDLLAGDREVLPLLREILALKPNIKIIATPWSAPRWMKTNQAWVGGKLRPECYAVYAQYFVKYLLAMRAQGIAVHAITPQNEPQNDKNDPSMVMTAEEQAEFIKNHLGPALETNGLRDVEIFCWDHNCDAKEYPLTVFADPDARRYLRGSAWHLYGGEIDVLAEIYNAYPEMKLYFTEQWVGADGHFGADLLWHVRNVLIGATRNGCSVVLEWNLASDPNCCPHTAGGETRCVGALTIDGERVSRNVAYYIIAHAAKWVKPGSVRIHSTTALTNAAFLTQEGQIVLLVLNDGGKAQTFNIAWEGQYAKATLPANSVATLVWSVGDTR